MIEYRKGNLLDVVNNIRVETCCEHRQDVLIHSYRQDKEAVKYLMCPGN